MISMTPCPKNYDDFGYFAVVTVMISMTSLSYHTLHCTRRLA